MRRVLRYFDHKFLFQTALIGSISVVVSGCSMDMSRFQGNPFGDPFTTGTISSRSNSKPQQMSPSSEWGSIPQNRPAVSPPNQPVVTVGSGNWTAIGGTRIIVGEGDSLTTLSHRYGVPEKAMLSANGLSSSSQVQSGAELIIPVFDATGNRSAGFSQPVSNNMNSVSTGSSGTLSDISPNNNFVPVPVSRPNISPRKVAANPVAPNKREETVNVNVRQSSTQKASEPVKKEIQTASLNTPAQTLKNKVEENPVKNTVSSTIASDGTSFRWPAKGRIIAGFGKTGNEGINIALPEGASVRAIEGGTVSYVGEEMKDFGKLVVIRHENGYVSVYAHNSDLLVKRGEKVSRGQVIAKSGRSGNVTTPQLHFEIRKGGTPVDPIPRLGAG
jgi:Membrane-bound metallopeptidase